MDSPNPKAECEIVFDESGDMLMDQDDSAFLTSVKVAQVVEYSVPVATEIPGKRQARTSSVNRSPTEETSPLIKPAYSSEPLTCGWNIMKPELVDTISVHTRQSS